MDTKNINYSIDKIQYHLNRIERFSGDANVDTAVSMLKDQMDHLRGLVK